MILEGSEGAMASLDSLAEEVESSRSLLHQQALQVEELSTNLCLLVDELKKL